MFDTVIAGGTIVDGTGAPPFTADIGIIDGRIAEIGTITAPARRTVDARGAVVTPGFIDIHSHYDGQFLWDDRMDPSFSHGVTTALAGYCGVGFAPVGQHRQQLMELMEGVEDIPEIVLEEGLAWDWESYPEYLDRLAERRYTMDIGSNIAHAPLRVYVMGERALRHEAATPEDIEKMAALVREAMAAGAVGFSNGRITTHYSSKGAQVPGTFADDDELHALARAMGESGRGVFQMIPKGANGAAVTEPLGREGRLAEHRRLEAIARAAGRPVTYTLFEFAADPGDCAVLAEESRRARAEGLDLRPQTSPRGLGAVQMLDTYHVFVRRPSYRAIAHLPLAERAAAMRDPARRAAILGEADVDGEFAGNPAVLKMLNGAMARLPGTYVLTDPLDCEPTEDRKVGALAAAAGQTPDAFIYDHYARGDGSNYNISFALNYPEGSLDHVHAMLQDPGIMIGLSDGGAHMRIICDASMPTFQLAFWARDRKRGPTVPLELAVHKLTGAPAELYGFADRGTLAVGKRADINVIDFDRLGLLPPRFVRDLPSGGGRLQQDSVGYLATFVAGEMTRCNDVETGARPGRLLRHLDA
ncbi:amidohydrolase family protein [Novosphingobium bradum]|uniref:Amidohydrolase family protein n=1 Tax=Novosphingobium bradum TaxID=1737444 RepID=A0ABV7IKP5_9SPHN